MSALHVEALGAGYRGYPVIANLSLDPLEPGTVTALVGPNAAGKSTLLKAIAGLVAATGSVRLGATELLALKGPERATLVGYLPQNLPAATVLTVLEGVLSAFRASGMGMREGEAACRAMLALDRLGAADLASRSLDRLSGGQRQLVGLAAAFVREPPLLLLDEPTSALDLFHQIRVMEAARAVAATGRVVVMVLHDLGLAARWADRIVVLDRGGVAVSAAPAAALTPEILATVYGVLSRVEPCSRGTPRVIVDGRLPPGESTGPRSPEGMP